MGYYPLEDGAPGLQVGCENECLHAKPSDAQHSPVIAISGCFSCLSLFEMF